MKLISNDAKDLQQALLIVDKWTQSWDLQLNKDKSEHLTLREKISTNFYIGNQSIPKVHSVRDLGVTIRDNLKWDTYINQIRSKANTLSHILLRTFTTNNTQLLTNLFKTYVRPVMEYNTCTWSPHLKSNINEAESVQRMFTRRLCKRANISFIDYNDRLEKLNLESLQSRRIKNDLILIYKMINNTIDMDPANYFKFSQFGQYNLRRHSLHITQPKPPNTLCRQNFFALRAIKHWNELPNSIVTAQTTNLFKHKIKNYTIKDRMQ